MNMDINYKLKVVGFFLTISEWDRHLEVIRQVLNAIQAFEPYAAYLRLTKGRGTPITPSDINDFTRSNGFEADYMAISLIVRLFDTRFEGSLDFEDFLKMILSRDNPEIRFSAAQRENYEVEQGDLLAPEIEYTLARFFFKASEFLSKIMSDPETHLILTQTSLFRSIDNNNSRFLDFHNLKGFFEESRIRPRDSEIIAILRIIDINDDGKINENEFNFFIELFSGKEPSQKMLNLLKNAHQLENQFNYFGEKMNQDPFKYDRKAEGGHRFSPVKKAPVDTYNSGMTFAKKGLAERGNRTPRSGAEGYSRMRKSGIGHSPYASRVNKEATSGLNASRTYERSVKTPSNYDRGARKSGVSGVSGTSPYRSKLNNAAPSGVGGAGGVSTTSNNYSKRESKAYITPSDKRSYDTRGSRAGIGADGGFSSRYNRGSKIGEGLGVSRERERTPTRSIHESFKEVKNTV